MKQCGPRQRVATDVKCVACADYEITDPQDPKLCKAVTCDSNSIVKVDGTCESCKSGFIASTDGKTCIDAVIASFDQADLDTPTGMLSLQEWIDYHKTQGAGQSSDSELTHLFYNAD